MRLRTFTASLVVAAAATLPLAGVASAQPDRDCGDFSSQEEAQDALTPADRERLDDNDNGVACEDFDYGSAPADGDDSSEDEPSDGDTTDRAPAGEDGGSDDDGQVSVVPQGGVDTGDGSSGPGPAPFLVAGAVAAAVAAGAARRARTSR